MTTLTDADRAVITRITRARCEGPGLDERQVDDVAALAVDLYETAARHGIGRADADGVTSFICAAIDGIRMRDRRVGGW
jgi:hypothetical protein